MISSSISAFFIGVSTAFFTIFAIHILCFRPNRTRFQTVLGYTMCVWAILNLKDLILTFPEIVHPIHSQLGDDHWRMVCHQLHRPVARNRHASMVHMETNPLFLHSILHFHCCLRFGVMQSCYLRLCSFPMDICMDHRYIRLFKSTQTYKVCTRKLF